MTGGRTVTGNRWDELDGVWPTEAPVVSVVVLHFRQAQALERTLAALTRQSHPADRLEVIVVDDGSPEPPVVPAGVALLRQEDRGFRAAAARNLGVRAARGEVLCFLDADTAPEPDYVRRLTRLPGLAPEAVTVGRRRHADPSAPGVELPAPRWLQDGYAETGDLLRADDRSYRFVIGAVLACSRRFFDDVGPFDEGFDQYGGEDWEWAHRAWLAGAVLAHEPLAVAWHDGPDWDGRQDGAAAARTAKNREAMRLAGLIPVPGSRAHAVRGGHADVVVRLGHASTPAAAFVSVDSVLAALPETLVVVPDAVAAAFAGEPRVLAASAQTQDRRLGRVRVVVDLPDPVRVLGGGLRRAVDRIGAEGLGSITLLGADGAPLAVVGSCRAAARAARWGTGEHFPAVREPADGLAPIAGEPDVEAYLGGWG